MGGRSFRSGVGRAAPIGLRHVVRHKGRNIKQYLRAMLFNAPSTINSYYASLVAHDMAQPDWGRPPNP